MQGDVSKQEGKEYRQSIFDIYKKLPKLIGYHSNLGLQQNLCEFYNPIHMFTNAEKPVETGVVAVSYTHLTLPTILRV